MELSETYKVDENYLEHIDTFSDTRTDSDSDSDHCEFVRHWAVKHQVPNVVTSDLLLI